MGAWQWRWRAPHHATHPAATQTYHTRSHLLRHHAVYRVHPHGGPPSQLLLRVGAEAVGFCRKLFGCSATEHATLVVQRGAATEASGCPDATVAVRCKTASDGRLWQARGRRWGTTGWCLTTSCWSWKYEVAWMTSRVAHSTVPPSEQRATHLRAKGRGAAGSSRGQEAAPCWGMQARPLAAGA